MIIHGTLPIGWSEYEFQEWWDAITLEAALATDEAVYALSPVEIQPHMRQWLDTGIVTLPLPSNWSAVDFELWLDDMDEFVEYYYPHYIIVRTPLEILWLVLWNLSGNFRVTEEGNLRVTEDNSIRVIEQTVEFGPETAHG
jgi:hypothetical protein